MYCPCADKFKHPIKLQQLMEMKLHKSKHTKDKFMCCICEKDFSIQRIVYLKTCKDVLCEKCLVITTSITAKTNTNTNMKQCCPICNTSYTKADIIHLQETGTSFSTHNSVTTSTFTPFFKY